MASTASSSSAVASSQAGPLPAKVGELGYMPADSPDTDSPPSTDNEQPDMADRHPADTPYAAPGASTTTLAPSSTTRPSASASTPSLGSASTIPMKRTGIWFRLTSSRAPPLLWGLQGKTLLYFLLNVLIVAGTVTGWAVSISHLNAQSQAASNAPQDSSQTQVLQMSGAMFIFVHVAFAMAVLIELIFMERMVFQLRAERWRHTHPGQALPRSRGGTGEGGGMAIAPWNRPPLPTYAAALGLRGTGDVEDAAIAVPPPPAYGNTRGSTLLLAAMLRRASQLSQIPESRPVSYRESDEEADGIADAIRARQLEVTLARLEEGGVSAER